MVSDIKYTPAKAALLSSGVIVTKHYKDESRTQTTHKIFFRFGSHLNRYSAKDYIRTYLYLEYGVTDVAFFAVRDNEEVIYATFSTDWSS